MRVPKDLQMVVGKRELRYTLNTGSLRQAKAKSKETSRKVKELFKQLKGRGMKLTEAKFNEIVRDLVQTAIRDAEKDRAISKKRLNPDIHNDEIDII